MNDLDHVQQKIKELKAGDSSFRRDAAKALGQIGEVRAIKALTKVLRDKEEDVRQTAAKALEQIGA